MKIVIDDKIPFIRGKAEKLGETVYLKGSDITSEDVRDAEALIIRTRTKVNETLLKDSRVRFVGTATIGFDHIDTAFLERNGVTWTNCPGCNAASVAQYVESSLILLERAGKITLDDRLNFAIVGYGHVGHAVEKVLERHKVRILRVDPFLGLNDDISHADVVSFHTPLTFDGPHPTFHLCDATYLSRLKDGVVIVNAARGGVVDENALLTALDDGKVREAVIDTWEGEPKVNPALLLRSFLATPHIAGYSADGKANATRMVLEALAKFLGETVDFNDIVPLPLPQNFTYFDTEETNEKLRLYDPRRESEALKNNPEKFEYLRAEYPLRRESE